MSLDSAIRHVLRLHPEGLTTSGLARQLADDQGRRIVWWSLKAQLAVMERDGLVLAEVHHLGRRQWTTWRLPPSEAWSS